MAEAHKINFYPKPAPPTNPRVKSFEEIQRLLAQAPAPPTQHISIQYTYGPRKLPFNALIVGPTNSGKTQYLLNQLRGPFRGKLTTSCSSVLPSLKTRHTGFRGPRSEHLCDRVPAARDRGLAAGGQLLLLWHQHPVHSRRLRRVERCQGPHGAAGQSRLQRQARWNLRVGLDPADNQHIQTIPGQYCRDRAILHTQ